MGIEENVSRVFDERFRHLSFGNYFLESIPSENQVVAIYSPNNGVTPDNFADARLMFLIWDMFTIKKFRVKKILKMRTKSA